MLFGPLIQKIIKYCNIMKEISHILLFEPTWYEKFSERLKFRTYLDQSDQNPT